MVVFLKSLRTGRISRYPIGAEAEQAVHALIADSERLAAIKRLREETGASVADCRAWVEERLPPRPTGT